MNEQRMQELKEHYLSQTDKPQRILMFEFFNHVKHEIRMGMRERENNKGNTQTKSAV